MPYKIPLLEVRSKETKGKMEETGEEFIRVFGLGELGFHDGADFRFGFIELIRAVGVNREVKREGEKTLLGLLELVAKVFQVPESRVQHRVANEPFLGADIYLR